MSESIHFMNALANIKDDVSIDEGRLRETRVYGKLMLKAGMKFDKVKSVKDFLLSEKGEHIRAELFWINKNDCVVIDDRMWLNVAANAKIMRNDAGRLFYVELIHPTINLDASVEAF